MSCWMSSSRVQTTLTGPSTCLAISTARTTPSTSSRRPKPPPIRWLWTTTLSNGSPAVLRGRRLGAREGLAADPDFAAVLADMNGAVHRLHGGVREERDLVGRLDLGDGARHSLVDIADRLRHRARIERRLFELVRDVLRAELGVRTVVPFDHQGRQPFLRSPHMVGDDGDGVVEPHDLTHALDRLGRRVIHALQATAEDG